MTELLVRSKVVAAVRDALGSLTRYRNRYYAAPAEGRLTPDNDLRGWRISQVIFHRQGRHSHGARQPVGVPKHDALL